MLLGTSAVSGFAGCGRRPSPSGSNTARQLPLRANEEAEPASCRGCNKGGTAYTDTSLAVKIAGGVFFVRHAAYVSGERKRTEKKERMKENEDYVEGRLRKGICGEQKCI